MRAVAGFMVVSACLIATAIVRTAPQARGQAAGAGQAQTPPAGQTPPPAPPAGQARAGGPPAAMPKNVLVLPKEWNSQQVSGFMRANVVPGTGMQCNDCHAADRSSDEKKEKQTARQMIKLMMAANDLVKDIGEPAAAGSYKVTCYTCHRGTRKPLNAAPSGGGL